ncbi:putative olfactory receptor 52P1 [Chelonia mydas]|uniref:putative olfactory receptor 52P1 n=1 Tax=Chelonia mydas TaxID=8469 RepID=UPI001CA9EA1F|nr:putative olfactory receptor 52P1 [Chelonia mydas]
MEELRPGICQVVVCENTNSPTDREGGVFPHAGETQKASWESCLEQGTLSISESYRCTNRVMAPFNFTHSDASTFILTGIPGLESAHIWISIPFFTFYVISLLGNVTLLSVVGKEQTLQKPMYLLLCILALTDIATPTFVVPKALGIFWFNLKSITVAGCLTQMFFLHTISVMHSSTLVTMAFDRYVAICNPLRYATILSNAQIAKLGLAGLIRAVLFILPLPLLLSQQTFCANRIIPHTQCEHVDLEKMVCGDITVSRIYGLLLMLVITGFDLTFIAISYGLIIRAVLRISSQKAHQKALNTCTAHICVMLTYYTPTTFSILTHYFGQGIAPYVHIILADLYLLIPPMLNPIIYGVKTKELRDKVVKYTCRSSADTKFTQSSADTRDDISSGLQCPSGNCQIVREYVNQH